MGKMALILSKLILVKLIFGGTHEKEKAGIGSGTGEARKPRTVEKKAGSEDTKGR